MSVLRLVSWSNKGGVKGVISFGVRWFLHLLICFNVGLTSAAEDYILGGGDTVNITVYEQPDLATVARISQDDGTIAFPLLGEVSIMGLSPEDGGRKIERMLLEKGYLKAPQVSLKVQDFFSQKVTVMGRVKNPGEYALKGESRVAELITHAGGLQDDAADVIVVVKNKGGRSVKHKIDVLRFYEGDLSQNIEVSKGDLILVPKMDAFYIHGEIKSPGMYRLERNMTVMQALSVGGGITGRGSLKGIKVTRRQETGDEEKVDVELADVLKPNDVIYIKERLF